MKPTIKTICYKSKILSNGEHPLMIRVCRNGNKKYKSLGISVKAEHWNFKTNKPKMTCPDRKYILKIISKNEKRVNRRILQLIADHDDFDLYEVFEDEIATIRPKPVKKMSVGEFYKEQIEKCASLDKVGLRESLRNSYCTLMRFTKNKLNIPFSKIDVDFLERFEKYLRDRGLGDITIASYCRTLRSIYNKAIKARHADQQDYPFRDFRISKFDLKARKKAISKEDVLKIMDVDLSEHSEYTQFSRDIFIFSYLCAGINFGDIIRLTVKNISDNCLKYRRSKTGATISIPLRKEAWDIVRKYDTGKPDDYLFPVLNKKVHITEMQKHNRKRKVLRKIDKQLKEVAQLSGVNTNLTTYVARHAYATVMKNAGVAIALISETLGHTSLTTTQIYLDSFENSQVYDAMENLL